MTKYYKIVTLGCKVNAYESEAMSQELETMGYVRASLDDEPDIIIVNTCSVTSASDGKSRQMINREHRNHPDALLIVSGCYSQLASEVVDSLEGVKIVIGTQYRKELPTLIREYLASKKPIVKVNDSMKIKDFEALSVTNYSDNTRAYLKIQDGCNNFCSYCIIPYARGRVRSRPKEDVINEAVTLVKKGFKELVLTGIHTAGYGLDLENYNFTDLLKDLLLALPTDIRIRISSIEESEISDEFIKLIINDERVVPHLHIPLQSGSDSVLKRMNRKYLTGDFEKTINKIREHIPDISITTDVIVGFPGESSEEFNETVDFIKRLRFSALHVFPYSRRSGTVADRMPNQIDPKVKKERVKQLINLSNELAKDYASRFKGKSLKVLFETFDKTNRLVIGHAPNYLRVGVFGDESLLNEIREVVIEVTNHPLNGGSIKENENG